MLTALSTGDTALPAADHADRLHAALLQSGVEVSHGPTAAAPIETPLLQL